MDYEKLSQEHFDRQAAEYDSRDTFYYSREGKISCRDIAQYLQNVEYSNLLDVGCGTGFLIDLLQKQRKAEYIGLDLSSKMIEVALFKNIPNWAGFAIQSTRPPLYVHNCTLFENELQGGKRLIFNNDEN